MKTKVLTPITAADPERKRVYRKIHGKSIAIPDQGQSVRQILERHTSAGVDPIARQLHYDQEGVNPLGVHPDTLDIVEKQEMRLNAEALIKEAEENQRAQLLENQKREEEIIFQKRLQEEGYVKVDPPIQH